jgi:hypothetical protein
MEVIKRKILLEEVTDRNLNSETWGTLTADSFSILIQLNGSVDDMGLFTDIEFIPKSKGLTPDYSILIEKLLSEGFSFPFMAGTTHINFDSLFTTTDEAILRIPEKPISHYYYYGNNVLTGFTDSKLDDVRSYNNETPYIAGFNIFENTYTNYLGDSIIGVNQVVNLNDPIIYVFDTLNNINIGTDNQTTGIQYKDYEDLTFFEELEITPLTTTTFRFITEGLNETNTSLSAITKEEFLMGIISRPEVENDVFIDRGIVSVLDTHLRLSDINNLGQLQQYGNGFYKIEKN